LGVVPYDLKVGKEKRYRDKRRNEDDVKKKIYIRGRVMAGSPSPQLSFAGRISDDSW
jgi:hypothetical protein